MKFKMATLFILGLMFRIAPFKCLCLHTQNPPLIFGENSNLPVGRQACPTAGRPIFHSILIKVNFTNLFLKSRVG